MINQILLKLFGVQAPTEGVFKALGFLFIKPWPVIVLLSAILFLILLIGFIYHKTPKRIQLFLKIFLGFLRVAFLIVLLLLMLEPVAKVSYTIDKPPHFIMLFDNSLSMDIPDPDGGRRIDIVNKLLADDKLNIIKTLKKTYKTDIWKFSSDVEMLSIKTSNAKVEPKVKIDVDSTKGKTTAIGDALKKAFEELSKEAAAGVILISDGGNNSGEDPIVSASILKNSQIPVYSIGIGDPKPRSDIKILPNIIYNEEVFFGDDIYVEFDVIQIGYKNKEVTVQIREGNEVRAEKKVVLDVEKERQKMSMRFAPKNIGSHKCEIYISPFKDELSKENNKLSFDVSVVANQLRILYIEGKPNRLFRFLRSVLYREPGMIFSVLLESNPNYIEEAKGMSPISKFPETKEELYKYDVLILGDIKRSFLNSAQYEMIKDFVADGRGFLLLSDNVSEGSPASYKGIKAIEEVLPVSLDGATKEGKTYLDEEKGFNLVLTPDGENHEITRLGSGTPEEGKKFWNELAFTWCTIVGTAKPTSVVLAQHPKLKTGKGAPLPLIALGRYGEGKTAFIGIKEIWLARKGYEDQYFWTRFFRPLFHWLMPAKGAGEKFVILRTDKHQRYNGGETVKISAMLFKSDYIKLSLPSVTVKVSKEGGETEEVILTKEKNIDGIYNGVFVPRSSGKYFFWLSKADGVGEPLGKTKLDFTVETPNLELIHPEMDKELLSNISKITNGKYYDVSNVKDLISDIMKSKETMTIDVQKELHDLPLIGFALISFLSVEWFIRRRRGLA